MFPVAVTVPDPDAGPLPYPSLARVVCSLPQTARPRDWCLKMTCTPWLDCVSTLLALLSCTLLCMHEPPRAEELKLSIFVYFLLEMVIKMVALGVVGSSSSYLSNPWNKLDVFVFSGEVVYYLLMALGLHLQPLEVLGPMRLIGRVRSMRNLVTRLAHIMPMVANVLVLYAAVVQIFGIVGVQMWAGILRNRCYLGDDIPSLFNVSLSPYFVSKFGERSPFICSPDNNAGMLRCRDVPPYTLDGRTCSLAAPLHPSAAPGNGCVNWNAYYNACRPGDHNPQRGAISFDNIGFASIAVFQVVMLEGWSEIMFYVMDAHSFWNFTFFILVTIMGSFIMLNVCAVVIATRFSELIKDSETQLIGSVPLAVLRGRLTRHLRRLFVKHRRVKPADSTDTQLSLRAQVWTPLKRRLEKVVRSQLFDRLISLAVFLSILTMVIEHHKQPKELTRMLKTSNAVFAVLFFLEMALKLVALTWSYFKDRNNVFDFAIVIVSMWELSAAPGSRLSVLRVFRLLRFVRLIRFLPYLKKQLMVLKKTMQEAAALCGLLLFLILIFSALGRQLFAGKFHFVKHNVTVTDRKNFDSPLWSMVTVFQILTLEDWNVVLYNAMATTSPWAALYFIVLIVLGKHVILNILVGIVVQNFQNTTDVEPHPPSNAPPTHQPPDGRVTSASRPEISSGAGPKRSALQRCFNFPPWFRDHGDWSLYMFGPQNRFRVFCHQLTSHTAFDHLILFFIVLNCATIAVERPTLDPQSMERCILKVTGYIFTFVFLVEMVLKVIALGLVSGKDAYCHSFWNVMDGSLVFISLVHILISLASAGSSNTLGILKVLRLLRTLRPLRVVKRAPKLKLAVEVLISSVKPIGNVLLICCAFLFFFGILGVQLFKGKFYHCVGADTSDIITRSDCLSANYQWVRKEFNFDNMPQALLSLFVMYSKDGWVNIMYDGLDAVGVDKQPVTNYNEWMLLYFIFFMIMSFLLLDMFVGIMVESFHHCQQKHQHEPAGQAGGGAETEAAPYYTHYPRWRRSVHSLCTSSFFEHFMMATIFISVLVMACEHYNQPQYVRKITEYSYYCFTVLLITEVLLKLVAFGALRYFKVSWSLLDIIIILISIVSILVNETDMRNVVPINPSILTVCRLLRITQVLKAKNIQVLLRTVMKTLSQVGNICLLFMFFFFIYAALGVELFGKLECSDDFPCRGLHRYTSFRHFGLALLALYQVCTGDNWSGIMKDTMRPCRPGERGCQSYLSWVSPLYFITFVIVVQFVLANLVVASIMQALEDSAAEPTSGPEERTGGGPAHISTDTHTTCLSKE